MFLRAIVNPVPPVVKSGNRDTTGVTLLCLFQLHIVDGVLLRSNPALVMEGIQRFLGVTPPFNYTQALMFVTHKHGTIATLC